MRGESLAGFSLAMGEEGEASALPLEGERIKVGEEKWLKVFPKKFEVLEFMVNLKLSGEEGEDGVLCAMVVTDISLMKDGGMLVYGRAIGSTDEEFLKTLHLEMNRRKKGYTPVPRKGVYCRSGRDDRSFRRGGPLEGSKTSRAIT